MSLKSFHLLFITASILFSIGFGVWVLLEQPIALESLNALAGLLCFTVGGGLVLYAIRFLRKFKNVSFM